MEGDEVDGVPSSYDQSSAIKGHDTVLVHHKTKYDQLVILGLAAKPKQSAFKRIARLFLPQAALLIHKKIVNRS